MRLVNRSYTQVEVEVSEGLGGGSRHMARTKQTGQLARMTNLQQVERHQAMATAVRQRRRHRRIRNIALPIEVAQVPPPRDVQVVQPEGVPRPEATATDPVADEAMAAGPNRRRLHQRTRDIAPPVEVAQVPPSRDVQVVQLEGVLRPEATATDPVTDETMAIDPNQK